MTRTSSPLLGVHFWNPARTPGYPVPTLFVEHVYTHPNGDPGGIGWRWRIAAACCATPGIASC